MTIKYIEREREASKCMRSSPCPNQRWKMKQFLGLVAYRWTSNQFERFLKSPRHEYNLLCWPSTAPCWLVPKVDAGRTSIQESHADTASALSSSELPASPWALLSQPWFCSQATWVTNARRTTPPNRRFQRLKSIRTKQTNKWRVSLNLWNRALARSETLKKDDETGTNTRT